MTHLRKVLLKELEQQGVLHQESIPDRAGSLWHRPEEACKPWVLVPDLDFNQLIRLLRCLHFFSGCRFQFDRVWTAQQPAYCQSL